MGERETKTAYEITQESKAKQEAQAKEASLKKMHNEMQVVATLILLIHILLLQC